MVLKKQFAGYCGRSAAMLCTVFSAGPLAVIPLALAPLALAPPAVHAQDRSQDRYPIDWDAVAAESMEYFSLLIPSQSHQRFVDVLQQVVRR